MSMEISQAAGASGSPIQLPADSAEHEKYGWDHAGLCLAAAAMILTQAFVDTLLLSRGLGALTAVQRSVVMFCDVPTVR